MRAPIQAESIVRSAGGSQSDRIRPALPRKGVPIWGIPVKNKLSIAAISIALFFFMQQKPVYAYAIDVHFYLTYTMAVMAGLSSGEAYLVARADQSLDDNSLTTAFELPIPAAWYRQSKDWHALNVDHDAVMERFRYLQCRAGVASAIDRTDNTTCSPAEIAAASHKPLSLRLIYLGEFLHYFQDTYAHTRVPTPEELEQHPFTWQPYRPIVGHFFELEQPDFVATNVSQASVMAFETYQTLQTFASAIGRHESPPLRYAVDQYMLLALVSILANANKLELGEATFSLFGHEVVPPWKREIHPWVGGLASKDATYHFAAADIGNVRCGLSALMRLYQLHDDGFDVASLKYNARTTRIFYDRFGEPVHIGPVEGHDRSTGKPLYRQTVDVPPIVRPPGDTSLTCAPPDLSQVTYVIDTAFEDGTAKDVSSKPKVAPFGGIRGSFTVDYSGTLTDLGANKPPRLVSVRIGTESYLDFCDELWHETGPDKPSCTVGFDAREYTGGTIIGAPNDMRLELSTGSNAAASLTGQLQYLEIAFALVDLKDFFLPPHVNFIGESAFQMAQLNPSYRSVTLPVAQIQVENVVGLGH